MKSDWPGVVLEADEIEAYLLQHRLRGPTVG